ncbi:hypothetical protein ACFFGV_05425 [Pontibacillus salicampi]|uniref:Uncharacterized protein n=2 Tax=Pontibacillus salicampi TaxID=1449801 RepID=A0ABV6LL62_9BACI
MISKWKKQLLYISEPSKRKVSFDKVTAYLPERQALVRKGKRFGRIVTLIFIFTGVFWILGNQLGFDGREDESQKPQNMEEQAAEFEAKSIEMRSKQELNVAKQYLSSEHYDRYILLLQRVQTYPPESQRSEMDSKRYQDIMDEIHALESSIEQRKGN